MSILKFASFNDIERSFAMLDLIPDTHTWVKDTAGRFVFGNRLFFERFGFRSMQGLIGKCDFDIAPPALAQKYCQDDALVLTGGEVTDRLELIIDDNKSGDWFLTSKWPIYDLQEVIMGSLGISRHLNRADGTAPAYQQLQAPVDYICAHFADAISVESLASACNLSVSALERRFRKHLNKTPKQYILEVRLDHARQMLLETDNAIGAIAKETGFSDHSHFTRTYHRYFGVAPRQERQAQNN